MLVVGSRNGSRAAFPDHLLHLAKRALLTIQIHRNVERVRLGAVGHCAPALESGSAGALIHFDTELRDLARKVSYLTALRMHLKDRLVSQVRRMDESASRSSELPEDGELAHLEKRL